MTLPPRLRAGLLCWIGALALSLPVAAAGPAPIEPAGTPEEQASRVAWWREARVGIFVHWGLYAIPGRGEWVQWQEQIPVHEYAKLADQFDPKAFDADAWATLFKSAGARYAVLTARHHDGFALYDSRASDFNSVRTAAHRDFVADYVKAMRKAGLGVGLYYSPLDWRFPGFFFPDLQRQSAEAMREQYHRQVEELLSQYGKIDILWFDGGQHYWLNFMGDWGPDAEWHKRPRGTPYPGGFDYRHGEVYSTLRRLQPQILINGRADMPDDFHSREGADKLGDFDDRHPWELCVTLNGAWGWKPDQPLMPLSELVGLLVQTVGRDGNFLLNVGPRPDGRIDPPQAGRLEELGRWLSRNGESVYGTRGGPFRPGPFGVSTHAGDKVYVHALHWPEETLRLPALDVRVKRARLLGGGTLVHRQTPQGIEVTVPASRRDPIDTIVVLELARPLAAGQPAGR